MNVSGSESLFFKSLDWDRCEPHCHLLLQLSWWEEGLQRLNAINLRVAIVSISYGD